MPISVFDLFTVGIGPSSSHTVGPMRAAASFVELVGERIGEVRALEVDVYGSLAATGRGHGTFDAILLGLEGCQPDQVLPDEVDERSARMTETGIVRFGDRVEIPFTVADMRQRPLTVLERHTNALELRARSATGEELAHEIYYSVGGGFVVTQSDEEQAVLGTAAGDTAREPATPYDFRSGDDLLRIAREEAEKYGALTALDMGPLGELLEPAGTLAFEDAVDQFARMVKAADGLADLVVIETMTDLYEVKAALLAVREHSRLPVFASMSFESRGRTFTGCTVDSFAATAVGLGADAVGINCSLGPAEILPFIRRLCRLEIGRASCRERV